MFSFENLLREFNRIFQADYIQSEINRLKKDLMELEAYQKIQKPTQHHLQELEKKYKILSHKILKKQSDLDKEFNKALNSIKSKRSEAEGHIRELQKLALERKNAVEKLIRAQIKALGLHSVGEVKQDKKKAGKKKTSKAKTSEKSKKKTSKSKTKS